MTILDELAEFCDAVAARGWHEYNGGNVSVLVDESHVKDIVRVYELLEAQNAQESCACAVSVDECERTASRTYELAVPVADMAHRYLLVTASGCLMKNVAGHLERDTGLIQINENGQSYSVIAGFTQSKRPTSELMCHVMLHSARMKSSQDHRVVYHAHTPRLIALSHVIHPLTSNRLTAELWSTFTECPLFCPRGIGVVDFCVPGSLELAQESVKAAAFYQAALWAKHGICVWGASLDDVFGLVETAEKAAGIALDVRSTTSVLATSVPVYDIQRGVTMLAKDDLLHMDEQLHLGLNTDVLDAWE